MDRPPNGPPIEGPPASPQPQPPPQQPPAASTAPPSTGPRPAPAGRDGAGRLDVVDWLRGLAVVLMIQTHLYDAWVTPAAKLTPAYEVTRFLGGIPSRLFLLLVGVSIALQFEAQLRKGVTDRWTLVRPIAKRGLEILALAYLFRLQEYVIGHLHHSITDLPRYWRDLVRVDILNCIGASMVVVPMLAAPRRGRPAYLVALGAAVVFIVLGPVIGPAHFPTIIPAWLSSYVGGQRPLAFFPLFPYAAWPLAGVALGHFWARAGTDVRKQWRAFLLTGLGGLLLMAVVTIIRKIDPHIIRYPSDLVQQMGPGSFVYRLGMNGIVALIGYGAVRLIGRRFSIMRQFGRTSLLVYWVHVDLCYGLLPKLLGLYVWQPKTGSSVGQLSMGAATVGLAVMVALMLALSLAKTRWWEPRRRAARAARAARARGDAAGIA